MSSGYLKRNQLILRCLTSPSLNRNYHCSLCVLLYPRTSHPSYPKAIPKGYSSNSDQGKTDATADDVFKHHQDNGPIKWIAAGSGHVDDIPEDVWYNAISAASNSTENGDEILARSLATRSTKIPDVDGFSAEVDCHKSGSVMPSSTNIEYVSQACKELAGLQLPNLEVNTLRIWQSEQVIDAAGMASYGRYGAKKLTDFTFKPELCEHAFNNFNTICSEKKSAKTKGGEIEVGGSIRFSAEHNQIGCNC